MKKTIMVLFLGLASVSWGFASNRTIVGDNKTWQTSGVAEWQHFEVPYMGTPINATLTADNGCVFVIHGNWSWTSWHFSGDVYVKCPGKQVEHYHFDLSVPADSGPVEFEGGDEEAWDAYFEHDTQLRSAMTELFLNSPPD